MRAGKVLWLLISIVGLGALATSARAKKVDVALIGEKDASEITGALDKKLLTVLGKTWDADAYCNDDTISNPGQLELFHVDDPSYTVVVLCPATLDGDENVVSVFGATSKPRTKRIRPPGSSHRITEPQLKKVVLQLLGRSR